jgi:indolepyruvate ferredoxin oxidoreductase
MNRIAVASDDITKYDRSLFPSGTTFTHRDDLDALQCELRDVKGASVLIYDQTCAAEKRRRRKRGLMPDPDIRPFINSAVCEGCGDCGKVSNCLSVVPDETPYGRKRKIEQSSCNKDMSCVKGFCPSFVTVTGGKIRTAEKAAVNFDFTSLPDPILPVHKLPYGIVLAGVGGTGVTTMGAILGMAAHIEGKGASVLDMTGLAQKFGAVITHLQIANHAEDIHAARIAAGGAKLVIGCDLVVAASNDSMVKVDRGQAAAIINSHEAMTAEFTRNPDAKFPAKSMHNIIKECVGDETTDFVDATDVVENLLGDTMAANIFLAGYAFQKGLIPISNEAIVEAIHLNGAGIEQNLTAFKLGRLKAHSPTAITFGAKIEHTPQTFPELIEDRRRYLTAYQNQNLADRYQTQVDAVTEKYGEEVGMVVARYYFKVLAYKDEYEVARLYSDGRFKQALAEEFEGDYKLAIHLAPPLLAPIDKHSGLPRKITFGSWIFPVFSVLAKFKFLRGSKLDPFSYTADRKLERQILDEYEDLLAQLLKRDGDPQEQLMALLALPEKIRGFGYVKEQSFKNTQLEQERLLAALDAKPEPVKIFSPEAA